MHAIVISSTYYVIRSFAEVMCVTLLYAPEVKQYFYTCFRLSAFGGTRLAMKSIVRRSKIACWPCLKLMVLVRYVLLFNPN